MKRWLLQSLFLAALLRRGGVEQNRKLTGKQLVVNLYSEIQITRVICVETSKNKKNRETTQQRSFTIPQRGSLSTIPEGEEGGGREGGGGQRVLSLFKDQLSPVKVIASKFY